MKTIACTLIALFVCLAPLTPAQAAPASAIPTFTITNVYRDSGITILTYNFPANQSFEILMGAMHTRGVGGVRAGVFNTGLGGSQTIQAVIPAALHGQYQIAVRLQSQTKPEFFAYNWFYNDGAGSLLVEPAILPSGKPTPTVTILGAARDLSVTVQTHNFPASHRFNVRMGAMGTRGVGGVLAQTITTGASASETLTVSIPAALRGLPQIALRFESANGTSGYYAYSWFVNDTFGNTGGVPGPAVPVQPGVRVLPTFSIVSVAANLSVQIQAFNMPPNKTFEVTMGALRTRGIGGYIVSSFNSGAGGSQSLTFTIPPALYRLSDIAIRLQSTTGGYYAYNWFYNR